jgi:hypothetical protein
VLDLRFSQSFSFYTVACRPLLCNDCEMGGYTRAACRQRLGKHFQAETNTHATIEVLLETGAFCWSLPRGYRQDEVQSLVSEI